MVAKKRTRKRASFTVPDDVTSGSPSGWVFRSDTAPAVPATASPAPGRADARRGPRQILSRVSLRPLWLPFAIAITTVIASLPAVRPGTDRS